MLKITKLSAHYGSVQALRGVSLSVKTSEIVTLIGANGAGKSTLMNTIFGYPRASGGKVEFDGQNISRCRRGQVTYTILYDKGKA